MTKHEFTHEIRLEKVMKALHNRFAHSNAVVITKREYVTLLNEIERLKGIVEGTP